MQLLSLKVHLNAKPVSAGRNVFFAFNKGNFTGFREYYVDADSDTNDADDITAAVPNIFLRMFLNLQ